MVRPGGDAVDPQKLLIDPYARALSRATHWDDKLYEGDSAAMVAKSVVVDDTFDWQGVGKPGIEPARTVIYETHVKGFTRQHQGVPSELRGTYLGICHPVIIEHLKSLGVTSVQLMPVAAFMSEPRLEQLGLTNYWGYNPIAFFAPEPSYSAGRR